MRIAVIGPQNTGKSTFIQDFLTEFPHYKTPTETYRDVIEKEGFDINQLTTTESQGKIRDFMFNQMKGNTEHNIVFDRCLIDNLVYSSVQYERGVIPKSFIEETEVKMKSLLTMIDLYLFIPTAVSIPLVDDGVRDTTASYIDTVNNIFLRVLFELVRSHHITVKVISGSRAERIEQVKKLL